MERLYNLRIWFGGVVFRAFCCKMFVSGAPALNVPKALASMALTKSCGHFLFFNSHYESEQITQLVNVIFCLGYS